MQLLTHNESSSNPGTIYQLFWDHDHYFCNCPGFKWNKKKQNWCTHCENWQKEHGTPQSTSEPVVKIVESAVIIAEAMAYVYKMPVEEALGMVKIGRAYGMSTLARIIADQKLR